MLIPNDISIEFDSSVPLVFDADQSTTFDGVAVFRYEPASKVFRLSYANEFFSRILGSSSSVRVTQNELDSVFGLSLDGAGLSEIFSDLLATVYPDSRTANFNLRSISGRVVSSHCMFSLIPLDLDGVDSASVAIICLMQDLGRSGSEALLGEAKSVATSMTVGNDLGKLCFQICRQLEERCDNQASFSMGVAGPTGLLSPVILGGLPASLVELFCEYAERVGHNGQIAQYSVDSLPIDMAAPLKSSGINSLLFVPVLGERKPVGEDIGHGTLFDFGYAPNVEFEMSGVIVAASEQPLLLENLGLEEILASAQSVASEAILSAYALSNESIESSHDSLTSLPNREHALEQLQKVLNGCDADHSAVCVMLLDVDKFQSINHSFGTEIGDRVLTKIADRLLASVRLGDQVARISSDRYLVVCVTHQGELDPPSVAKRVLNNVNRPVKLNDGSELAITASLGMVSVNDLAMEPLDILSQAEAALASSAAKGRGEITLYDTEQEPEVDDSAAVEQAIKNGLEAGEFRVYYQPLVETDTHRMVGAEALIRWEHPADGLVSPALFIPAAEESGLILDLGMWVIDKVCEDLSQWPANEAGRPIVTVNLAAKQLQSDMLVPGIISALRRHGLHPSSIGFEITESMEIANMDVALATLAKLKELNCRIAIDDFGIGHATMEYLRNFSMADALKIDRSFVSGVTESIEDQAIVKASLALADALGMQVVAEGVETKAQLAALAELKCRYSQGFGFSKPVPIDEIHEMWMKGNLAGPEN